MASPRDFLSKKKENTVKGGCKHPEMPSPGCIQPDIPFLNTYLNIRFLPIQLFISLHT